MYPNEFIGIPQQSSQAQQQQFINTATSSSDLAKGGAQLLGELGINEQQRLVANVGLGFVANKAQEVFICFNRLFSGF